MYFTRNGYRERDKVLTAKLSLINENPHYELAVVKASTISQLGSAKYKERQAVPSLQDVLSFLYNLAQGQRVTTPPYLDQFIDRYGKTFFREDVHLRFTLNQESITNITALSNYYHMTRNNKSIGCVEALADEYLFCCGTIGKMLWDATHREKGEPADTELVPDKKRCNIFHVVIPDDVNKLLANAITSEEDAIMIAEGALACGCWKDHSTTNKDLENNRIRDIVDVYKPFIESAPVFNREEFICNETFSAFKKSALCPKHEWIIDASGKRVYDRIGDGGEVVLDSPHKGRKRR